MWTSAAPTSDGNSASTSAGSLSLTLRVLSRLLEYPDTELREHLDELRDALCAERAVSATRLTELLALLNRFESRAPLDCEAEYVELFDRGRRTSLLLFEHVHGDSRDRGPAMIDLARTYEQAGLYLAADELPDHLPTLLEFASTQPPTEAAALLGEIAPIVRQIFSALVARDSPYASVLAAVLDLAGEPAQTVNIAREPDLDEAWEEPAAFDGCSTAGQSRPSQANQSALPDREAMSLSDRLATAPEVPIRFITPVSPAAEPPAEDAPIAPLAQPTGARQ